MPRMPFIGVRISWLMLARKALLARCGGFGGFLGAERFLGGPLTVGDVAVAENSSIDFAIDEEEARRGAR